MTRASRILVTIYAAVTLWFAYCTVQTWGRVPLWTSITMAAASLAPIVAGLRESEHADDMRAVRVQLERASRPPLNRPAITERERARFDEIIAGFNDKDQAA